jgi:hypothetical protein
MTENVAEGEVALGMFFAYEDLHNATQQAA